jgi:hypothetical protein
MLHPYPPDKSTSYDSLRRVNETRPLAKKILKLNAKIINNSTDTLSNN